MTLEELLNKLIEKGWKPFGESRINEINRAEQYVGNWNWCCWGSKDAIQRRKSTRQLVSKESGLWQFVCENKMIKEGDVIYYLWDKYEHTGFEPLWHIVHKWNTAEYRLIESALCDEDKLEQFLLDNIKVDE